MVRRQPSRETRGLGRAPAHQAGVGAQAGAASTNPSLVWGPGQYLNRLSTLDSSVLGVIRASVESRTTTSQQGIVLDVGQMEQKGSL